ncbi:MAG: hypothetical protein FVQ83_13340 [Chloroflexi bacterium]|nr:hypothetical protein [Chloroflexota bacterium]
MAPIVKKTHLFDSKNDAAFWRTQPFEVRLGALERIRQEFNSWKYNAEPRIQRVHTIIKR